MKKSIVAQFFLATGILYAAVKNIFQIHKTVFKAHIAGQKSVRRYELLHLCNIGSSIFDSELHALDF